MAGRSSIEEQIQHQMPISTCTVMDAGRDNRPPFFNIRACHPNADSYKELSPKHIYKLHEDKKKLKHASRIIEVENGNLYRIQMYRKMTSR